MTLSDVEKQIRQWLATDEAGQLLARVALLIRKTIKTNGIPLSMIGLSAGAPDVEIDKTIRSELAMFILENRVKICEKIRRSQSQPGRLLSRTFINHLLDKTRSSAEKGGQHYYYKRFRDTLAKTDGFYLCVHKTRKWSSYSRQPDNHRPGPLADEDIGVIPWPEDLPYTGDTKDIQNKESLIRLAGWFWNGVVRLFSGKPVWIPLQDLVGWVGRFIQLSAAQTVSIEENAHGDSTPFENKKAPSPSHQEEFIDRAAVKQIAASLAGRLKDMQAQIYYLRYGEGLGLEQISAQLGLKSASAVKYHLDQAQTVIYRFLNGQPLQKTVDHEMTGEAERIFFAETLLELLKNR